MSGGNSERGWVITQSVLLLAQTILGVTHRGSWHSAAGFAAGAALIVLAAIIGVWGVCALGGSLTPYPTPKADAELVQSGIYRHLRHPLYSSMMLATLGWALLWQSAAALAVAVVLCAFLDVKARLEERLMQARFPEYAAYRGRTRRFLPWVY